MHHWGNLLLTSCIVSEGKTKKTCTSAGGFDRGKLIERFSDDFYHHSVDVPRGDKEYKMFNGVNVIM